MDRFPGYGEFKPERCSLARRRPDVYFARMLFYNAVAHRKTQPGAASGGLGGEEGIENTVEVLRRNTRAGVGDLDFHGTVLRGGAHLNHSAVGHGVARIHEQIQEHLLKARDGAEHGRQLLLVILDHVHARGLKRVLHESQGFFEHGIQVHFDEFGRAGAGEVEKIVDDFAGAEGLLDDALDGFLPRIVGGDLLGEHLDVVGDDGERRIHLMRHAGSQQAEGSELFGLHHLLFEAHALGDVVEENQAAQTRAVFANQRGDRRIDDQMTAAAGIQPELVDAGDMVSRGARRNFGNQIRGKHFAEFPAKRVAPRNFEQVFELRVPGFDAVFEIHREHADLERFHNVFAEILEALDLHSFLFERLIQARVFNGDGHVAGNGGEQFQVVARKVIAVHRLAEAQDCDGTLAKAAGDEIIEVELVERAADRVGLLSGGARRFEEEAAALERRPVRVEKAQVQRTFGAQAHRARKDEAAGMRGVFEKPREPVHEQSLRNAVEDRAEKRLDADFVGKRAPELDERAAEVEAIAVEKAVEASLHPVAQGLEKKRGHDDGDYAASGARGPFRVEQLADQGDGREINPHHAGGGERVRDAALENDVHIHQPVADDGVTEAKRDQRQGARGHVHPGLRNLPQNIGHDIQRQIRERAGKRSAGDPLQLLAKHSARRAAITQQENDGGD